MATDHSERVASRLFIFKEKTVFFLPLHLTLQSQTIEVVSPAPRGTPGVRDGKRVLRRAHLWPAPAPAAVNTVGACRGHEAQRQDGTGNPGAEKPRPHLPVPPASSSSY